MFFNFIFDLFLISYYFCSWDYITEHYGMLKNYLKRIEYLPYCTYTILKGI